MRGHPIGEPQAFLSVAAILCYSVASHCAPPRAKRSKKLSVPKNQQKISLVGNNT